MTQHKPLHRIFTAVPTRYDLVNRIITWGMDARWRRLAAGACITRQPQKVLDLCCGTGDLALCIAHLTGNNVQITGLDYSLPMLAIATRKTQTLGLANRFSFIYGDVASLPFRDSCFDCIGISFAFRNLTYRNPLAKRYLAEIQRVLRPGGRFVIVESGQPANVIIRKLFHLYLRWFVFPTGYLASGNRGAYRYLAESAANYYTAGELKKLLLAAGFRGFQYQPLFMGAAGIGIIRK